MKHYKFISITLLSLGLVFSVLLGFNFNLSQGFEFKGFWFYFPPNLMDIAFISSGETLLKSNLIGYVFYLIFGIIYFKQNPSFRKSPVFIAFLILVALVFISDFYSMYLDFNDAFNGRHFRVGLIVFILGILSYRQTSSKLNTESNEPQ